jgi:hypothetical protein
MGSPAIAALVSNVAFWGLLAYGRATGDLSLKRIAIFLLLWLVGRIGLPFVPYGPASAMFPSFVAVLDVALVFTIFKGDIKLT